MPSAERVTVTFVLQPLEGDALPEGAGVVLAGSLPELGEWQVPRRLVRDHTQPGGACWRLELAMPQRSAFEYKYLVVRGAAAAWEAGPNRCVALRQLVPGGLLLQDRFDAGVAAPPQLLVDELPLQLQTICVQFQLLVPAEAARPPPVAVYVLADRASCGAWGVQAAQRMQWVATGTAGLLVYSLLRMLPQVELPMQYKYALARDEAGALQWEHGGNRTVRIQDGSQLVSVLRVQDLFRFAPLVL